MAAKKEVRIILFTFWQPLLTWTSHFSCWWLTRLPLASLTCTPRSAARRGSRWSLTETSRPGTSWSSETWLASSRTSVWPSDTIGKKGLGFPVCAQWDKQMSSLYDRGAYYVYICQENLPWIRFLVTVPRELSYLIVSPQEWPSSSLEQIYCVSISYLTQYLSTVI